MIRKLRFFDIANLSAAIVIFSPPDGATLGDVVSKEFRADLRKELASLDAELAVLELGFSRKYIKTIDRNLNDTSYTHQALYNDGSVLQDRIEDELEERMFGFIPPANARFYDQPDLFGPEVAARYSAASDDILAAGNCLALGLDTACVFHLMRVVETGLRDMAKKLHVALPRPVDLEEWGKLIHAIEKAIALIELQPRTASREKRLLYFHGAAAQFRHFKNAWRNHVMHSRASYTHRDARELLYGVQDFMRHLASP